MFEKMRHLETHADGLRKRMLREPRGYPAANCNLILPPDARRTPTPGFVIMEQTEYPGMSGTNTICVTTALLETGMLPMREPVTELTLEAPAGLIRVRAECAGGKVRSVTFRNVPAFAVHLDRPLEVPHLGTVTVDVAWGGMFYVIAEAAQFGLRLDSRRGARHHPHRRDDQGGGAGAAPGRRTPSSPASRRSRSPSCPGPPSGPHADARNAVIVSTGKLDWNRPATWTGAIDRSPCGTGTCARDGRPAREGKAPVESRLPARGDPRHGLHRAAGRGRRGWAPTPAVVPTISGTAWITGFASYVVDPEDPFPEGFTVGDIW